MKKPTKAIITFKADAATKARAQRLGSELGITLSAVLNQALREFAERGSLTFERPLRPTPYLEKILRETEADIKAGRNLSPTFTHIEDMRAWLEAPDDDE